MNRLKVSVFSLFALMQSPVWADSYYMIGSGRIQTTETGREYGSTNLVGLVGAKVHDFVDLEGEFSFPVVEDTITITGTNVDIGLRHAGVFVRVHSGWSSDARFFGRIGYVSGTGSATVGATTVSVNDTAAAYGVGFEFGDATSGFRVDFTAADWGAGSDSTLFSLGWYHNFGSNQ